MCFCKQSRYAQFSVVIQVRIYVSQVDLAFKNVYFVYYCLISILVIPCGSHLFYILRLFHSCYIPSEFSHLLLHQGLLFIPASSYFFTFKYIYVIFSHQFIFNYCIIMFRNIFFKRQLPTLECGLEGNPFHLPPVSQAIIFIFVSYFHLSFSDYTVQGTSSGCFKTEQVSFIFLKVNLS